MLLCDVNIFVYAVDEAQQRHSQYRQWLEGVVLGDESFGFADLVAASFVRIATNRRILKRPVPLGEALDFIQQFREHPNCVVVAPGSRHWGIFLDLCRRTNARANLVPDAYFAALAIESGSEWITTDRDYARFSGLRWRHPLEG